MICETSMHYHKPGLEAATRFRQIWAQLQLPTDLQCLLLSHVWNELLGRMQH